jgi:hypothetical protein
MKCLLVETRDRRKFFTHEKNFGPLIEFSKSFNASLSLVDAQGGELLDLEELALAVCNPLHKTEKVEYKVLEAKVPIQKKNRKKMISNASKIQKFLLNTFLNGKVVDLKSLKKKYKNYQLTDAALCNHIKKVRDKLLTKGYAIDKVGAGRYRMK